MAIKLLARRYKFIGEGEIIGGLPELGYEHRTHRYTTVDCYHR